MIAPIAVLDACVLYSAALRDLFMRLANDGLYVPKWTEHIHDEWIDHVLENRPDLTREKLERTRALMNLHAEGSLVVDYEHLVPTITLPDAGDRHVLAAAIAADATVIVTCNLADFPASALAPYDIAAQHPDVFACALFDQTPDRFLAVIRTLLAALSRPPQTWNQHLDTLRKQGLQELVQRLAERRIDRE